MSLFAVAFWFAENIYFGWNMTPKTPLEGVSDFLVIAIWVVAYFVKPSRTEITNNDISTDNIQFISPKIDKITTGTQSK